MKIFDLSIKEYNKNIEYVDYFRLINNEIFLNKYGFDLPNNDINKFIQILYILNIFVCSDDELLFINETIDNPEYVEETVNSVNFPSDILMLKNTLMSGSKPQMGYQWGYKWSDLNFIITKNAARNILQSNIQIDECFSDKILTLSDRGLVKVDVICDHGISINEIKINYDIGRNDTILTSILNTSFWDLRSKILARNMLAKIFEFSKLMNLNVFVNEGTLLGLIRHGKIMDWDDDIDIAVDQESIEQLVSQIEGDIDLHIEKYYWQQKYLYFKVWAKNGLKIDGYNHKFPFIDLWIYNKKENGNVKFNFGDSYPTEVIFPFKNVDFEETTVFIPNNYKEYLSSKYPSWDTEIIVYPYSHRNECAFGNLFLKAYISTDSVGRMIHN